MDPDRFLRFVLAVVIVVGAFVVAAAWFAVIK